MVEYILIYLLVINLITILVYGADKARARRGKWRISEATLLFMALIGGSVGALLGMYFFHHKTKHLKFKIGVPIILILQIIATIVISQRI